MTNEYSIWADMLSKFHTSSDWIQALWLIAVPAAFCGIVYCLCWCIREIALGLVRPRDNEPDGEMLYSINRVANGQLRVYCHAPQLVEMQHDELLQLVSEKQERLSANNI
jgi:hypothetical protein